MKIFVTGGTGFIGSHIVKRLVQDSHEVTCLVRKTSDTHKLEKLGVALAQGDVTNRESVARGMQGCATVSHVINKTRFVSEEIKERVAKAIQDLNYQPNAIARSLVKRKTHTIGDHHF